MRLLTGFQSESTGENLAASDNFTFSIFGNKLIVYPGSEEVLALGDVVGS